MPYGREDEYTGQEAQDWEILQQNMPNASEEEKSQVFQQYKQEKAISQDGAFDIYRFLEGMGIGANQNPSPLPEYLLAHMKRGQQGPPMGGQYS